MNVRVEHCWEGGDKYCYRLTFPGGGIERIRGEAWTREVATQARDIGERLYCMERRNIRFIHR